MARDPAAAIDAAALTLFLQRGAAQPFDWLACNCGFWVCDWIKLVRGFDPVGEFRRRFKTAAWFKRMVAKAGGNEMFSRGVAACAGLVETDTPKRGDVGLITTAAGATMAIYVGDGRWAAKSPQGVLIADFPLIVAWSV